MFDRVTRVEVRVFFAGDEPGPMACSVGIHPSEWSKWQRNPRQFMALTIEHAAAEVVNGLGDLADAEAEKNKEPAP